MQDYFAMKLAGLRHALAESADYDRREFFTLFTAPNHRHLLDAAREEFRSLCLMNSLRRSGRSRLTQAQEVGELVVLLIPTDELFNSIWSEATTGTLRP
jgi:hypothetical protein